MYEPETFQQLVHNKIIRSKMRNKYQRLSLVTHLKSVEKLLFIKARLTIINLLKEQLIHEVSFGQEVLIPQELRPNLPSSFKFYDPVIAIL